MNFQDIITNEITEYKPSSSKDMFIKGIIHFTDNDKHFEIFHEEFFFNHLEKNGEFLSQSDFDLYLEHELPCFDWDIEPKEDEVYGVLYHFKLNYSRNWTDCGYEYDSESECLSLEFSLFDEKATKNIFEDVDYKFSDNHEEIIDELSNL